MKQKQQEMYAADKRYFSLHFNQMYMKHSILHT